MKKRNALLTTLCMAPLVLQAADIDGLFKSVQSDPIDEFGVWLKAAQAEVSAAYLYNAVLATVDQNNMPWQRAIHISSINQKGFVFNTHHTTNKIKHILKNKQVSLLYLWEAKDKQFIQIRVNGVVQSHQKAMTRVSDKKLNQYFHAYTIEPSDMQYAWVDKSSNIVKIRYLHYAKKGKHQWQHSMESYQYPKVKTP